jgi:hypothetical protein
MGKKIVCFAAGIIWIGASSLWAATTAAPAQTPAVAPAKPAAASAAGTSARPKAKAPVRAKAKIPTATPTVTETATATVEATPEATAVTPEATVITSATGVSSSLPKEGSVAWNVGIAGWQATFHDMQVIYGGELTDPSPFGGELDLGADLTLAPFFQIGLQAQGIMRAPEELHLYDDLYTDTWNVNAVGGALVLKYLEPIHDKVNVVIHAEGGYYSLVASSIVGGGAASGTVNLDASNFGGMVCIEAEMLLDASNSMALDIGLGYRYLKMSPVSLSGTYCNIEQGGSLQDPGGADSTLDLSGMRMNATLRFY